MKKANDLKKLEKYLEAHSGLIDYLSEINNMAKHMNLATALAMADIYRKTAFDFYNKGNKFGFKVSEDVYKIFLKRAKYMGDVSSSKYSETLEELTN